MALLDDWIRYAQERSGGMPWEPTPNDRLGAAFAPPAPASVSSDDPRLYDVKKKQAPQEVDFSAGFPVAYTPSPKELMDRDLAKTREANPIPLTAPPPMQSVPPIPGLLGNQISQMPAGVGESPPAEQPGQGPAAAPQMAALPPPIEVGPPPGGVPAPAAAAPGAPPMPQAAPPVPPQPQSTDVSARAVPQPPAAGAPPEPKGLLQRLDDFTTRNPALLLSLAAGFSGAPSFGTGMSRAFGNATSGLAQDQKVAMAQGGVASTYRALVAQGVPPQVALAAAQNPEILKQIGPEYLSSRKSEIKTVTEKDAFGNERTRVLAINPYDQTVTEVMPRGPVGGTAAGGAAGGAAAGSGPPGGQMFAPGVTMDNFDHTKVGDDYLAQFSPEVQHDVKAYLRGATLPTARQAQQQTIKRIAIKYGDDIGMPADDQSYFQRKTFANSLADTKSGIGMQTKGFQQGLQHAASLSDALVKKANFGGFGIEPVANAENWVRNLSSTQKSLVNEIGTHSHNLAGEIGKLFSGTAGGGVREREEAAKRFGDPTMSPTAAAGALEATVEAMHGGLTPLEQRRDELFPRGDAPKGANFVGPNEKAAMEKIRRNIKILRGEEPAAAAAPQQHGASPLSQATAAVPAAPAGVVVTPSGKKVPWTVVSP